MSGTHSSTRGRPLGQSCLPHRGKLSHIRGRDETENDCHSPACSQSRPSLLQQQDLGPASGRVGLDSTGRVPGPQVSSWADEMARTDRSRSLQGGPPPVLGSSLLCRWRVIAHPCPWTVHLHEWLRTANGFCLLRNSNETSQYHRRGVALLDTLWQSNQPFSLQYIRLAIMSGVSSLVIPECHLLAVVLSTGAGPVDDGIY